PGPKGRSPSHRRTRPPLTAWAVVRATPADDRATDRGPAARARLAGAVVHHELVLHPALPAAAVPVRAKGRAVEPDGFAKDPRDRLAQPGDLLGLQRSRAPERMDLRPPEG